MGSNDLKDLRHNKYIYAYIYCFIHALHVPSFHICHYLALEDFNGSHMMRAGRECESNCVRVPVCVRVFLSASRTRARPRRGELTLMMSSAGSGSAHSDTKTALSFPSPSEEEWGRGYH